MCILSEERLCVGAGGHGEEKVGKVVSSIGHCRSEESNVEEV